MAQQARVLAAKPVDRSSTPGLHGRRTKLIPGSRLDLYTCAMACGHTCMHTHRHRHTRTHESFSGQDLIGLAGADMKYNLLYDTAKGRKETVGGLPCTELLSVV